MQDFYHLAMQDFHHLCRNFYHLALEVAIPLEDTITLEDAITLWLLTTFLSRTPTLLLTDM